MVSQGTYYVVEHKRGTRRLEIHTGHMKLSDAKKELKQMERRGDNVGNKFSPLSIIKVMKN